MGYAPEIQRIVDRGYQCGPGCPGHHDGARCTLHDGPSTLASIIAGVILLALTAAGFGAFLRLLTWMRA